jgi:Rad52/22 family double-strand break repair protein
MTTDIFIALRAPFPADRVGWRVGPIMADKKRGLALCYIDARDVADRLDDVCGPAGWQCRYSHANGKTVCDVGVKCDGEWIWKADGAGDTDMEAEKGALSAAFKRSACRWGIGRYLYDVESPWVAIEQAGKSYKIEAEEFPRLRGILLTGMATSLIAELRMQGSPKQLVSWGESPAIRRRIESLDAPNKERVRSDFKAQLQAMRNAENLAA